MCVWGWGGGGFVDLAGPRPAPQSPSAGVHGVCGVQCVCVCVGGVIVAPVGPSTCSTVANCGFACCWKPPLLSQIPAAAAGTEPARGRRHVIRAQLGPSTTETCLVVCPPLAWPSWPAPLPAPTPAHSQHIPSPPPPSVPHLAGHADHRKVLEAQQLRLLLAQGQDAIDDGRVVNVAGAGPRDVGAVPARG